MAKRTDGFALVAGFFRTVMAASAVLGSVALYVVSSGPASGATPIDGRPSASVTAPRPGLVDYVWVTLPVKFTGILANASVRIVPSSPANCVGAASNLTFEVHLTSPVDGPSENVGAQINRNSTCNKEASYQGFSVTMTFLGGGPTDIPAGAKATFPIWFGQRSSGTPYFMMCGTDPYGQDPERSYAITGGRGGAVTCRPNGYHTTITIMTVGL